MKILSDNYEVLRRLSRRLCREARILCLNSNTSDEFTKFVNIELPILESLTFMKERELVCCLRDYKCVSTILKMSSEITQLAFSGKYIYNISIPTLKKTIKVMRRRRSIPP